MKTVENRETIVVDGRAVSLARLDDVLGLARRPETDRPFVPVIVLGVGDRRVAFRVDAVLNEQEVLVKRLGRPLVRVRNIAGATVLGSGRPVPILNVDDLLKSAARSAARPSRRRRSRGAGPRRRADESAGGRKSVLIAEDSVTARMLVKNILESAGYDVTAAVDGVDALTALKTGEFDLVVSDVEMPRMDGIELTTRIRADPRLADLPVVLVTALATREDRERGAEAARTRTSPRGASTRVICWTRSKGCCDRWPIPPPQLRDLPAPPVPPAPERRANPRPRAASASWWSRTRPSCDSSWSHLLGSDPGIDVVGAVGDGQEALDVLARLNPDVVTVDVNMPRMDGFELTRRIMESHPLPVVIVSASWEPDEVATTFRAVEAGAVAVAGKPRGAGQGRRAMRRRGS